MKRAAMSISTSASSPAFPLPELFGAPVEKSELEIVGNSAAMKRLRLQIRRIGPHFRTVLVSGESGTGKELVARKLHAMSLGASGSFVACHAAALENLLVECAANGGSADPLCRLMKRPQGGTLFLDGINEMPLEGQGRLVGALKKHELMQSRLEASQRIDLRLIASTCEDLRILASTGRFRQDLYQLLATVDIAVPPLRERMEDLPELARCFLGRFALLYRKSVHGIADEAIERMQCYCWPGNVRELESVLRNTVLRSESEVLESHHLPVFAESITMASATESVRLQDVVEQHVLRVLKNCGGNKLRAAEVLGISRSTLYRMLDAGASVDGLR
jgi:DNA-binding NtrC family response regulator